jgi:hypothetical protein
VMDDVPTNLAVSSIVEITLTIQENYQIRGRAFVPSLARESKVVINIPIPPQKSLDELSNDYRKLKDQAEDAMMAAGRGALFGDARAKRIKDRMRDVEEKLDSQRPEPAAIQSRLDEIGSLVREIKAGWKPKPPRAVFDQQTREAEGLLQQAIREKPEVKKDGYDRQLEAIRAEAAKAYEDQNSAAWKDAHDNVQKLCRQLKRITGDGGRRQEQDPNLILIALQRELAELEDWAKNDNCYARFRSEFDELSKDLKKIDPQAPDVMGQIRDWYFVRFEGLRQRVKAPETDGLLKRTIQHV